jgi:carboxymethylenebutenolidase
VAQGKTIELKDSHGNPFRAYLSQPKGGRGPGVVMGLDIHGLRPLYHDIADLFAEQGYLTVVPDYFWDVKPGEGGSYRTTLKFPTCIEVVKTSMAALKGMPECNGRLAVTGFCLGGNLAYLGVSRFGADAATSYYGTRIHTFLDEVDAIKKPLILHIAEHDTTYPDEERDKILAAVKKNPQITAHVYKAPHGFASSSYTPDVAKLAHERSFALFNSLK